MGGARSLPGRFTVADRKKQVAYIDGLSSVRAVRRSGRNADGTHYRPSSEKLPVVETPSDPQPVKPAKRIGQTALPAKFNLICYECGFRFVISGALKDTLCPKCHAVLSARDHRINSAWSGVIRTVGTVSILPGANPEGGSITTRLLVLEADAGSASLTVSGTLELCTGGSFDPTRASLQDVSVRADHCVLVRQRLQCRNLDLHGELTADVAVTGMLTIRAGGCLRGAAHAAHWTVEEGGGVCARMTIAPGEPHAPATGDCTPTPPRKNSSRKSK